VNLSNGARAARPERLHDLQLGLCEGRLCHSATISGADLTTVVVVRQEKSARARHSDQRLDVLQVQSSYFTAAAGLGHADGQLFMGFRCGTLNATSSLVQHRLLEAVDNDELDGTAGAFQLQPQLLLHRGEEVGRVEIRRWRRGGRPTGQRTSRQAER